MGGVSSRDLFHRQRVLDRASAGPAVLGRDEQPHQAELAHLLDVLGRERLVLVVLSGDGSDLALGELAHRAAEQLLILAEHDVHP
jgi:hypothetical protein